MTRKQIVILSTIGVVLTLFLVGFLNYTSIYDRNVELKSEFKAQMGVIEGTYDNMWTVMHDEAGIADKYAKDFKEIYIPMIEGRYSKGDGALMKWVTEHNPNFDVSLYKNLMQSVEALRTEFLNTEKRALSIVQEHDNLRHRFWSRIFLGDEKPLEYKMITTSQTKKVMKSGSYEYEPLYK